MLAASWRVLRPGSVLFCRLAGQEDAARALGGRYTPPDGPERFLADKALFLSATAALGGELLDPLKTTIVHGRRSMMTWIMRRAG